MSEKRAFRVRVVFEGVIAASTIGMANALARCELPYDTEAVTVSVQELRTDDPLPENWTMESKPLGGKGRALREFLENSEKEV
jgi:cytochrome c556